MAIRIDLLPRYVALRRIFKRIAIVCALVVMVLGTGLSAFYYQDYLKLQTLKANVETYKPIAANALATEKRANDKVAEAQPLQTTVNFFVDAARSGSERAAILDLIRRYIYDGALIASLDISDGTTAKLTASVRTPDDYARFLLNLRRGKAPTGILFSNDATASGIGGYPAGSTTSAPAPTAPPVPGGPPLVPTQAPAGGNFEVFPNNIPASATLKDPIVVPAPPGEAAAPAAAGAPAAAAAAPPPGATAK